jgi:hypothetical protein
VKPLCRSAFGFWNFTAREASPFKVHGNVHRFDDKSWADSTGEAVGNGPPSCMPKLFSVRVVSCVMANTKLLGRWSCVQPPLAQPYQSLISECGRPRGIGRMSRWCSEGPARKAPGGVPARSALAAAQTSGADSDKVQMLMPRILNCLVRDVAS